MRFAPPQLRPAERDDIPAIVTVDRAAFTPHWWHSGTTLQRRAAASPYFIVAELDGRIVGYAEGEAHPPLAHLNRIAVCPHHQGQGIGASLLSHILHTFWDEDCHQITLNTQSDNQFSQRLYSRFGFRPVGDSTEAWDLRL